MHISLILFLAVLVVKYESLQSRPLSYHQQDMGYTFMTVYGWILNVCSHLYSEIRRSIKIDVH